jgi:TrmH family RNA methyltransferase
MRSLPLTSLDNPRLKQVLHLRKPRDRRKSGLFIAEGWREVERAIAAGLKVHHLFFCPQSLHLDAPALAARLPRLAQSDPFLLELPPALLKKITYHDEPEGLLAVIEQPQWGLDALAAVPNPLWLVANGINKPGNLGAMARTAAAANATGLIAADADVDPFNPNALRASTGAVFTLPIFTLPSDQAIRWLKQHHIHIAAATLDAATPYTRADLAISLAIAIGREETGLSAPWLAAADLRLTIPMSTTAIDSLNASTAAAILLFESLRQRNRP